MLQRKPEFVPVVTTAPAIPVPVAALVAPKKQPGEAPLLPVFKNKKFN